MGRRRVAVLVSVLVLTAVAQPAVGGPVAVASAASPSVGAIVPMDPVESYVRSVYLDLFGREPDPGGLVSWSAALGRGTPRVAVANSITSSEEFRSGLIADSYEWYLFRSPDAGGLRFWLDRMAQGWTIAQMESGFIASDEYWAGAGGSPSGWVTALYQDVLGRDPASSEVGYWTGRLAAGASRGVVAMGFLLSTEHLTTVVNGYYQWLLGRDLDPSGRAYWVRILQGGGRDEAIIGGIIASDEYWQLATAPEPGLHLEFLDPSLDGRAGEPVTPTVLLVADDGAVVADVSELVDLIVEGVPGACSDGVCVVGPIGSYRLTARWDGLETSMWLDVERGPLDAVWLSASSTRLAFGASVMLSSTGQDRGGNSFGDLTALTAFDVDGDAAQCDGARCTPSTAGTHTITGSYDGHVATVVVHVSAPGGSGLTALSWGNGVYGQQGDGTLLNRSTPAPIDARGDWVSLAAGQTSVGIRTDGSLWGWGRSWWSPLGDGTTNPVASPQQIGSDSDWAAVAAGSLGAGLKQDGSLWVWNVGPAYDQGVYPGKLPVRIGEDRDWATISLGPLSDLLAIKEDGSLWGWGWNAYGVLGDGTEEDRSVPVRVGAERAWASVSAGAAHTAAIAADGSLWSWGDNEECALGDGTTDRRHVPTRIGGERWSAVAAGYGSSAGVRADGTLWVWGNTGFVSHPSAQQLDCGPRQVGTSHRWVSVSVGVDYAVALDADGVAWAWGSNWAGQLGDGTTTAHPTPQPVAGSGGWTWVGAGQWAALALAD